MGHRGIVFDCLSYPVSCDAELDVLRELSSVGFVILLRQGSHVVGDVSAHDVLAVDISVELFAVGVVAGETFVAVWEQYRQQFEYSKIINVGNQAKTKTLKTEP